MADQQNTFQPKRQHLLALLVIALGVYVLLPQIGAFHSSWQLLRHPRASYTLLAVLFTFGTYLAGTATYCFLAFRPLQYARTLIVQLAAMFVNRLLPAGIGALGANYLYLRHEKHTNSQAVSVVAVNNLLGFLGHGVVVALTLFLFSGHAFSLPVRSGSHQTLLLEALIIAALALLGAIALFSRRRVTEALLDIKRQLYSYRRRPWTLFAALLTSMSLTLCNILALFFCLHALGLSLSFPTVLLVFTFGVGAGAAVPTPGGLGGFEAGLAAGFVAYGIDAAPALAAALLYRLVSYWLPLLIGLGAFIVCQKQRLFSASS